MEQSAQTGSPRPRSTGLRFAKWIIVALATALTTFVLIVVIIGVRGGTMQPLTGANLDEAVQRWEQNAAEDYDIEIQVSGRQASRYHVEVRGGEPRRATRNGEPLTQRRTWWTWTATGMFETLRADVHNMKKFDAGEKGVPHLSILVEFDKEYGFPRRYVRVESVKMGGNPEVSWQVTDFNAVQ
jgi:hypothetical protein